MQNSRGVEALRDNGNLAYGIEKENDKGYLVSCCIYTQKMNGA